MALSTDWGVREPQEGQNDAFSGTSLEHVGQLRMAVGIKGEETGAISHTIVAVAMASFVHAGVCKEPGGEP